MTPRELALLAAAGLCSLFCKGDDLRHRQMMDEMRRIRRKHGALPRVKLTFLVNGKEVPPRAV